MNWKGIGAIEEELGGGALKLVWWDTTCEEAGRTQNTALAILLHDGPTRETAGGTCDATLRNSTILQLQHYAVLLATKPIQSQFRTPQWPCLELREREARTRTDP